MMSGDLCLKTFTGKEFHLLNFKPEDFCIEDIAHSLSNTCRYVGHGKAFYSVAEHSIKCCERCTNWTTQMWGLLHDAAEAYIGDISSPLKKLLLLNVTQDVFQPTIYQYEESIVQAIAKRFDLSFPIPEEVHKVDRQLLKEEMRDLWSDQPIVVMTPEGAERIFLACFKALGASRNKFNEKN